MPDEPQNAPKQGQQKSGIPEPVQLAQKALQQLAAEGDVVAEDLKKRLPVFAMQLARSGEEVTVDLLLNHARAGELDKAPAPKQKQKTYAKIVAGFSGAERKKNPVQLVIKAGDLDALKQLVAEGVDAGTEEALVQAAWKGHLDIVKYLVEEQGADIPKWLLREAAEFGQLDVVKYFVEEQGVDANIEDDLALLTAAENGHLDIVKYFIEEQNANAHIDGDDALVRAARYGYLDVVKYLVEEQSLNVHVNHDSAFVNAAGRGHLDVVKYLVEEQGIDVHGYGELALGDAAQAGHLDVVKYLVEQGVDMQAVEYGGAFYKALEKGHLDVVKYMAGKGAVADFGADRALISATSCDYLDMAKYFVEEHGADVGVLKVLARSRVENYIVACPLWQKAAHINPPPGLCGQDPAYFKPKAFSAVYDIFQQEGRHEQGEIPNLMPFYTAGLFGTEDRVLQYLEKWGKGTYQPLHNITYAIKLPAQKTPEMDLAAWGDAVLKCGPSMAALVKFADRLPAPEKSADGKTWSMVKTREKVAEFYYERAAENPELSALCMEHDVDEEDFNKALELSKKIPAVKNIPDIAIDGEQFDMPGAKFHRLAIDDLRGLFLGEMTDCCQSIGGVGEECAKHGFTSENGGFYVVENAKGRIVGEAWAWRGEQGELVFDSLETLGQNVKPEQWQKLTQAFGAALAKKPDDVTALHIGISGYAGTPKILQSVFSKAATAAKPVDRSSYQDSAKQIVVWSARKGQRSLSVM